MPPTEVILFREVDGSVPLISWLDSLQARARAKCLANLNTSVREFAMSHKKFQSKALQSLHDRYIGEDPEQIAAYEQAVVEVDIASQIHQLRTKAGLSQRELAVRVGTTASVICRLEDAEYEGHSLAMLRRIAAAVGQRVVISFVPIE